MKNNTSILEEVAKKKKYLKVLLGGGIVIFIIVLFFAGKWYEDYSKKEVLPEYFISIQQDLKISVEEDGEIKNPQDFNLAFLTSGRIKEIFVKEGQKVKTGEKLAIMDTQALDIAVKTAQANINNYYGQIKQKNAENTDLEYIQAQEDLVSIQSDIVNKERTTQQAVTEAFDLAIIKTETGIYRVKRSLDLIDSIFGFRGNSITINSGVFHDSIRHNKLKNDFQEISRDFDSYNQNRNTTEDYSNISRNLVKVTTFNEAVSQILDQSIYLFSNATASSKISQQSLTSSENLLAQEKMLVNQEIQNLIVAKKNTENSLINQQTQVSTIVSQQNQIKVKTINAEKMATQREITKDAGLSILYAQLAQAKAGLESALYNLSLATLVAPSSGEILDINKEVGEIAGQGETFIKVLSEDNFIVEIYVEELSIVRIKIGQKANIRIAALNDEILNGIVSYISSNAAEDSNGVITYLVRLEITDTNDDLPIKEKMTSSVEFVIDETKDAIVVPVEAIYVNKEGNSAILLADMTEVVVETGLSDNNFVEIKKGLEKSIKIIKNPTDFIDILKKDETDKIVESKELLPEIKEDLIKLEFNESEIKKIEKGEMSEELSDRLKEAQKAEKGGISNMMKK